MGRPNLNYPGNMQVESPQISSASPVVASAAVEASNENSRRLDNSLLDKSLDELIKANRFERKSQKGQKRKQQPVGKKQPTGKPQNGGFKKFTIQELRAGRKPIADQPPKTKTVNKSVKNGPRNTPGIRQPWDKPVSLPAAPLPAQPLKISIRNELAERSESHSMDWSSTSPSSHHSHSRYSSRDRVEGRKEYRIGSRDATQPMNIDYDYNRRY